MSNGIMYPPNPMRDFNPFLKASDKLEDFIRFCGRQGVRREEMLRLPVGLFVSWLIVESAKADGEPEPAVPLLPDLRRHTRPRCLGCGRFLPRELTRQQIGHCTPICFNRHYARVSSMGAARTSQSTECRKTVGC